MCEEIIGSLAELAIAPGCNPAAPFEVPGSNPGGSTKVDHLRSGRPGNIVGLLSTVVVHVVLVHIT